MNPELMTGLLALSASAVTFVIAMGLLRRWEQRRPHWQPEDPDGQDSHAPLPPYVWPDPQRQLGWSERLDGWLDRLVENSGLILTAQQLVGLMALTGLALGGILFLVVDDLGSILAGLLLGMAIPFIVVQIARARLRWKMRQQLPDAFFFLARSLRAGLSFEQAVEMVGTESPEPLAAELRRCSQHLKLGLAVPATLQLAADRMRLPDFYVFVSVVALHNGMGGNLALILDRLAATTRDRIQYLGYFRSATALGRSSAIAIGCAVPVLFLCYLFIEPEYAQRFFATSTGLMLLGLAFGLEIVGAVWLYFLLKVDY